MRRKKRERVSCKADTLCPRCAPACKCAQAFPRIRHAQLHVPGFVDLHARDRRRAGLKRQSCAGGVGRGRRAFRFLRRLFDPDVVPTLTPFSVSTPFRLRCRSDPDAFSVPTPFRLRCRSYSDVFPTPTSFQLQRLPDEAAPGYLRKMQKKSRSWADVGSQRTCRAEASFDGSHCPIKA